MTLGENAALNELALTVVAADPSDELSYRRVVDLVDAAFEACSDGDPARSRVQACREALSAAPSGTAEERARCYELVSDMLEEIESGWQRAPVSGGRFERAAWVEQELLDEFLSECTMFVEEAEVVLVEAERGSSGAVAKLKRMVHTLKGEAGAVGLDDIVVVCHAWETWIETPGVGHWIDRQLEARDWLRDAISAYAGGNSPAPSGRELAARLEPGPELESVDRPAAEEARPVEVERDEETVALLGEFITETEEGLSSADLTLMNIEKDGFEAEMVHGLFRTFHSIKGVAAALELSDMTKLAHSTEAMLNMVRQNTLSLQGPILDLVFDSTAMMRTMLHALREAVQSGTEPVRAEGYDTLVSTIDGVVEGKPVQGTKLPRAGAEEKLGRILTMSPIGVPEPVVERALERQQASGKRLGEELVTSGEASPKQVAQALRVQRNAREDDVAAVKLKETIKVDVSRVDSLLEMIGELVIVETMVVNTDEIAGLTSPKVRKHLSQLGKITRDLQDVGMRLRMVPVRSVFQKISRVVRDLSRKGNKEVRLVTLGESTEIDRSMVQEIADPLVHMIRNAVDHAIEPAEERRAAGKPATGTITLSAYHEGGSVVIEVADDGKGLSRQVIAKKAIANGLISDDSGMSDNDVFELIFAPGFSTAAKVTEISGRGVGMDVVRRNVEGMRGRVLIRSELGRGTTFKIVLPLTLAIIDGMLVAVGNERYIIPTLSIVQSLQPTHSMIKTLRGSRELIEVRGEIIPLLRLARLFDIEGSTSSEDPTRGLVVVIESGGKKTGLLVDDVVTQYQVVIKSLGEAIEQAKFVAGAAILSDGHVGLIINTDEIACLKETKRAGTGSATHAPAELMN